MFQEPDIDLIDPREEHQFYGGEKFDYNGFYNDLESDPLLLLLREELQGVEHKVVEVLHLFAVDARSALVQRTRYELLHAMRSRYGLE